MNYHNPDLPRLQISPRHTAIADLADATADSLPAQCRSARRQEEGYANDRENLSASNDGTIEELTSLFLETFARHGVSPVMKEREMLPRYAQ